MHGNAGFLCLYALIKMCCKNVLPQLAHAGGREYFCGAGELRQKGEVFWKAGKQSAGGFPKTKYTGILGISLCFVICQILLLYV